MEPGSGKALLPKKSRFIKYKQFATAIFDATAHFKHWKSCYPYDL